ncbi:MAG TPA: ATP-binding protein [Sumerlaeia bacterium]|nr:ATP-binding protein [Sumerlaeia bacterium]
MSEKARVLVVDDDDGVRRLLSRQLTALGYACEAAEDGGAGLEALKGGGFDVALIDLQMPVMDGLELLAALQDAGVGAVPVVLSGRGDLSRAVEAMKRGAFDFLEKPVAPDAVARAVERARTHGQVARRALEMARLAEEWESVFDASPDVIVITDPELRILRCNRSTAARRGMPKESLAGRLSHEALCRDEHLPASCPFNRSARDQEQASGECEIWGSVFEVTSVSLRDRLGKAWGSMHVARDIGERKRAEDAVRQAHMETERLLASISSILIGVGEDGKVARWNTAAESAFGVLASEAIGKSFWDCDIHWNWETVRKQIETCRADGRPRRLEEIRCTRADGQEGILALTFSTITKETGERSGFLLIGADITERRFLEAQLAQAQKLEAIGQLAAGIAHEINTPTQYVGDNTRFLQESFADLLGVLSKYDQLLSAARQGAVNEETVGQVEGAVKEADVGYLIEEIPKAIQESLEGVERVARIVRSMKEFSHPGGAEKAAVDINKAIENTLTVARNEWKYVADTVTEFDPDLPLVSCLPGDLNQVILNLIVNAAHAIADVVGDGSAGKGTIAIGTRRDGDWAEIRVRDTGPGIPESIRDKIFSPFFTTKEVGKGTGQGLAIAHSVVVDKHGGSIRFETQEGEGTTFIIRLPIGSEH